MYALDEKFCFAWCYSCGYLHFDMQPDKFLNEKFLSSYSIQGSVSVK